MNQKKVYTLAPPKDVASTLLEKGWAGSIAGGGFEKGRFSIALAEELLLVSAGEAVMNKILSYMIEIT